MTLGDDRLGSPSAGSRWGGISARHDTHCQLPNNNLLRLPLVVCRFISNIFGRLSTACDRGTDKLSRGGSIYLGFDNLFSGSLPSSMRCTLSVGAARTWFVASSRAASPQRALWLKSSG